MKKIDLKKMGIIIGIALILLIILFCVRTLFDLGEKETKDGIAYLKKLENQDIEKIESQVKEVRKESMEKAMEEGSITIWQRFQDYVIFGDSRTIGFTYHELLDSQRVFAETGNVITNVPEYIKDMETMNPSYVFLCVGLNDMKCGLWDSPEEYVISYQKKIEELKEIFPDAEICVNSIFPVQEKAYKKYEGWKEVPLYNEALKKMCADLKCTYIDNTSVYEEYADYYEEDGIHFKKDFYEYWAINMLDEVGM